MTVQERIDRIAEERRYWKALRGLLFDEGQKHIVEAFTSRIVSRMEFLSDALDKAEPEKASKIAELQGSRRELKNILEEFDIENIKNKIFMLDNSIKELQDSIQNKPIKGTSGAIPPQRSK